MEDDFWLPNTEKRRRYYEISGTREPSPLLKRALSEGKFNTALELGSGAGVDAKEMAGQGLEVTAVDINPEVQDFLKDNPEINVVISSFQDFEFGKYDFIYSKSALVFLPRQDFDEVIEKAKNALNPGGVFTARFWGVNDSANKEPFNEKRTFVTKEEIEDTFDGYEIIELKEIEKDGETALGNPKHWHLINLIARKSD